MKKILSLCTIGLLIFLVSCSDEKTESTTGSDTMSSKENSMAEKNLAAFHVVSNAFETGDVSGIDSVVAADFISHTERGDMGRDSLKAMIVNMKKQFADMKTENLKELADNDYIMGMRRYSGTSNGEMGMPPKGQPYNFRSIEVVKFKDGKATEHWAYMEMSDMMKMMAPPAPEKK
jgi:predicted ester cyclase